MDCCICNKPISGEYWTDLWDNKMCASHLDNDAADCDSCLAFTRKEHILPDGRDLCKVCFGTAIKRGDSVEQIKTTVVKQLNQVGFDDLRIQDIYIEIVTAQKLAELQKKPIDTQNKGLTLSNTQTEVSPGFFFRKIKSKMFRHDIYMLTHQTKMEFAGTLAHEMLHAWQVQNGIKMQPKMVEGFCNMGTYLMFISMPGSLSKVLLKSLHESDDPIYGDGFREVYAMYEDLGWKDLIKNVKEKKIK